MKVFARLLATLLMLVLTVRAAEAQSYFAPAGKPDPYAPSGGTGQRYPLSPGTPGYGGQVITNPGGLPPVPQLAPASQSAAMPTYNPANRYPFPPTGGVQQPQQPMTQGYAPVAAPPGSPLQYAPPQQSAVPQNTALQSTALQSPSPQAAVPQQAEQTLFQPGQIVATVGNQYILYGDVLPIVNQMIESALAVAPTAQDRENILGFREKLEQKTVMELVNEKLLYLGFMREIESKAPRDKLGEIRERINSKTTESFETKFAEMREKVAVANREQIAELARQDAVLTRLAMLMKEKDLETMAQLDTELRRVGSSLQKQQRTYRESILGRSHIGDRLKDSVSQEVTHQEMLDYYKARPEKYGVPARAKFEIITVRFSNHPSREAARQKLAALGNEIFLGGAQFGAVAKKGSEEPNASKGGVYDWTTKGSLASEPVDHALFTLPPESLSQIIEDDLGCHILRVIDREDAGFVPFPEAQKGIKDAIIQSRREKAYKDIIKEIQEGVVVWTIYDKPEDVARQNSSGGAVQR